MANYDLRWWDGETVNSFKKYYWKKLAEIWIQYKIEYLHFTVCFSRIPIRVKSSYFALKLVKTRCVAREINQKAGQKLTSSSQKSHKSHIAKESQITAQSDFYQFDIIL